MQGADCIAEIKFGTQKGHERPETRNRIDRASHEEVAEPGKTVPDKIFAGIGV